MGPNQNIEINRGRRHWRWVLRSSHSGRLPEKTRSHPAAVPVIARWKSCPAVRDFVKGRRSIVLRGRTSISTASSLPPEERALRIVPAHPDIDQLTGCDSEGRALSQKLRFEVYYCFRRGPSEALNLEAPYGSKTKSSDSSGRKKSSASSDLLKPLPGMAFFNSSQFSRAPCQWSMEAVSKVTLYR
jgi:hypothetical protein